MNPTSYQYVIRLLNGEFRMADGSWTLDQTQAKTYRTLAVCRSVISRSKLAGAEAIARPLPETEVSVVPQSQVSEEAAVGLAEQPETEAIAPVSPTTRQAAAVAGAVTSEFPFVEEAMEEYLPESPAVPGVEEHLPESPAVPGVEEHSPESPAVPGVEEHSPESPAVPDAPGEEQQQSSPAASGEEEQSSELPSSLVAPSPGSLFSQLDAEVKPEAIAVADAQQEQLIEQPANAEEELPELQQTIERPILFSGPMIKAILAGHKTQTRRLVKLQAVNGLLENSSCPHGQVGDRLWVREKWAYNSDSREVRYAADDAGLADLLSWKPSIHMPPWASRLELEITSIRHERLQDITLPDAIAEGVDSIESFKELWLTIHGTDSWNQNSWVWTISFKKIDTQQLNNKWPEPAASEEKQQILSEAQDSQPTGGIRVVCHKADAEEIVTAPLSSVAAETLTLPSGAIAEPPLSELPILESEVQKAVYSSPLNFSVASGQEEQLPSDEIAPSKSALPDFDTPTLPSGQGVDNPVGGLRPASFGCQGMATRTHLTEIMPSSRGFPAAAPGSLSTVTLPVPLPYQKAKLMSATLTRKPGYSYSPLVTAEKIAFAEATVTKGRKIFKKVNTLFLEWGYDLLKCQQELKEEFKNWLRHYHQAAEKEAIEAMAIASLVDRVPQCLDYVMGWGACALAALNARA